MEKLKELVVSYISKTQGKTPEEVSSLLFKKNDADNSEVLVDDALTSLLDLDKARVNSQTQRFDTEKKDTYDKGYNKAKAESLSKFEKGLRDKYQISEDKQGDALVEAILEKQSKASGTGDPTEDQVKRSKTYLDAIEKLSKEKADALKAEQDKYETREKQLQREATFKTISEDALKELKKLDPILPEDAELLQEWETIFLDKIKAFDYEIKDGKKLVLKKEGETTKLYEDEHGHPVSFESIVKQSASKLFKFKAGEDRSGTGNKNNNSGTGTENKGYKGQMPKSKEEYLDMVGKLTDEKAQIELTKAWNATQTQTN